MELLLRARCAIYSLSGKKLINTMPLDFIFYPKLKGCHHVIPTIHVTLLKGAQDVMECFVVLALLYP